MFMTWFMFSWILSLFTKEPERQYLECELSCGQRLWWIQKKNNLENEFLKPEYPFKCICSIVNEHIWMKILPHFAQISSPCQRTHYLFVPFLLKFINWILLRRFLLMRSHLQRSPFYIHRPYFHLTFLTENRLERTFANNLFSLFRFKF